MENNTQKNAMESQEAPGVAVATTGNFEAVENLFGLFQQFEEKLSSELGSLTSEYLQLKENTEYDFIFTGLQTLEIDGKEVESAVLLDKERKQYTSGAIVLVNACKRLKKVPSFIRIITGEKVKTGAGSYLAMEVKSL
jgi:hypothetical protein